CMLHGTGSGIREERTRKRVHHGEEEKAKRWHPLNAKDPNGGEEEHRGELKAGPVLSLVIRVAQIETTYRI
ncbi:hypothetical protein LTR60_004388, partial [Cryomyces antarcticus]